MYGAYYSNLYKLQDEVLRHVGELGTPFYLTGGTALSRFFLHHRYSDDLDLFVNWQPEFEKHADRVRRKLHQVYGDHFKIPDMKLWRDYSRELFRTWFLKIKHNRYARD